MNASDFWTHRDTTAQLGYAETASAPQWRGDMEHRLCLSLFSWAKFRKRKAAVKLHTLLGYYQVK